MADTGAPSTLIPCAKRPATERWYLLLEHEEDVRYEFPHGVQAAVQGDKCITYWSVWAKRIHMENVPLLVAGVCWLDGLEVGPARKYRVGYRCSWAQSLLLREQGTLSLALQLVLGTCWARSRSGTDSAAGTGNGTGTSRGW